MAAAEPLVSGGCEEHTPREGRAGTLTSGLQAKPFRDGTIQSRGAWAPYPVIHRGSQPSRRQGVLP